MLISERQNIPHCLNSFSSNKPRTRDNKIYTPCKQTYTWYITVHFSSANGVVKLVLWVRVSPIYI